MSNQLEALRQHSAVVADTGDFEAMRAFRPTDATTNPSLILKAVQKSEYRPLLDRVVRDHAGASTAERMDRLLVAFGQAILDIVPGRVSTEVDARLSFDTRATVERARAIMALYAAAGIPRERVLIKIASTWEGIRAAEVLQKEGIDCNLTLLFSKAQAVACGDAGVFLISPFVGRILDWHVKNDGRTFTPEEDPGVLSVRGIYADYKSRGVKTVVMGASFRSTGEIEALAGCDRLTIAPNLLQALDADQGTLERQLSPGNYAAAPTTGKIDERAFRWEMNEDAMATEKLAEGIRGFAKDLGKLRTLIAKRVEGTAQAA